MKTRTEVARFVEQQFQVYGNSYTCPLNKGGYWSYGKQDVRALLDFIFDGPPAEEEEKVHG